MGTIFRAVQRATLWLASTRAGSTGFRLMLPTVDRVTVGLTRGRWNFTELFIPTLILTSTGHRSGRPRESPLCYVRDGSDLIVVGSNWGQEHHPAWTENLIAAPAAQVLLAGKALDVVAEPVGHADWHRFYSEFERMGPNYTAYLSRAGERVPRMFRLSPAQ